MSASAQKAVYLNHPETRLVVHSDERLPRKILVVDEQAHILRVVRLNLHRLGYRVEMALNSESALNLMREHPYDVLIITSDLPDMNARQLCENVELQFAQTRPLILVGGGLDDGWVDTYAHVERLSMPISLLQIVDRLREEYGELAA